MVKVEAASNEIITITLRSVIPGIPEDEKEKERLLVVALRQTGCHWLLLVPWNLKDETLVQELVKAQTSEWQETLRARPDSWTTEHWEAIYSFPNKGDGFASRTYKHSKGKFTEAIHQKDGYAVADCKDADERRVLEFLVPILNPEHPNQLTVTLANTIFGALSGDQKVRWGLVVRDLVAKMAPSLGKSKPSGITPFLYHLYESLGVMRQKEESTYKAAIVMMQFDIKEECEEDVGVSEGSEEREESSREIRKGGGESSKGKDPIWHKDRKGDELDGVIQDIERIKVHLAIERGVTKKVTELLGVDISDVYSKVQSLLTRKDTRKLEKKMEDLTTEVTALRGQVKDKTAEVEKERRLSTKSMETFAQLKEFLGNTEEVVNKARMFNEEVQKEGVMIGPKIVSVLVEYHDKMEQTLAKLRLIMQKDPQPETRRGQGKATPSKSIPISPMQSKGGKLKSEEVIRQPSRPASRLESEAGRGSTPGFQTQNQSKGLDDRQETPTGKKGSPSIPVPGFSNLKQTPKRSRDVSLQELSDSKEEGEADSTLD